MTTNTLHVRKTALLAGLFVLSACAGGGGTVTIGEGGLVSAPDLADLQPLPDDGTPNSDPDMRDSMPGSGGPGFADPGDPDQPTPGDPIDPDDDAVGGIILPPVDIDPYLPTPSFGTGYTTVYADGGLGRVGRTAVDGIAGAGRYQVDGEDAVVLLLADSDFTELLADPSLSELLADDGDITFGDSIVLGDAFNPQRTILGRGENGDRASGTLYRDDNDRTLIYVDDHTNLVVGYEARDGADATIVGSPVSNLPSGSHTYSGFAFGVRDLVAGSRFGTFQLDVDFDRAMVTRFNAHIGNEDPNDEFSALHGRLVGMDIPLSLADGSFMGDLNFIGTEFRFVDYAIIYNPDMGTVQGQFHGDGATGVSGLFQNDGNDILGGFAGSREPAEE